MIKYRKILTVFLTLLLISLFFSGQANADNKIKSIPEEKVGNKHVYDLKEKIASESLGKAMIENLNKSYQNTISYKKVSNFTKEPVIDKVIDERAVKIKGKEYKTKISLMNINFTFDIIPEETHFTKINMNISLTIKTWQSKNGTIKKRTEMFQKNTFENYTTRDLTYLYKYRYIQNTTYEEPRKELNLPLMVGKSWKKTVNRTSIINETSWKKAKGIDQNWSKNGPNINKKRESITNHYEVLSEVNINTTAGDFECLKLNSYVDEYAFNLNRSQYRKYLKNGSISPELKNIFKEKGYELGKNSKISKQNGKWLITIENEKRYRIEESINGLKIYSFTGTYTYLSKEGVQVKINQYGPQTYDFKMVLTDYNFQNLDKKNNKPDTLEDYWWAIIAGTAGIIFGLSLAYSKRGKGKEEYETGTAEGYDRFHPEGNNDDTSNGSKK